MSLPPSSWSSRCWVTLVLSPSQSSLHLSLLLVFQQATTTWHRQSRHVKEDLVQVEQVVFDLLDDVVPLLDLRDDVHHLPTALLLDCLLQECLAGTRGDEVLYHLLVGLLPRHGEVPPPHGFLVLSHDVGMQALEAIHQVLELTAKPNDHRRPHSVDGGP